MKKIKIGECETKHYYSPGKQLSDIDLKKMHNYLIEINKSSGSNVANKLLDENLTLKQIRLYYTKMIVGLCFFKGEVIGFLLSPILKVEDQYMLHGGLLIIGKNPGVDIITLLSFGNGMMAFEKLGTHIVTNISSTPSIIESFTKLVPGCWPNPNVDLRKPPKKYSTAVRVLKNEYMDRFFPDSNKLEVDYKRFVLRSNSSEMGFETDFFKISRASRIEYLTFCKTWLDYTKEEDMIQVGETNLVTYLRMQAYLTYFKYQTKKAIKKTYKLSQDNEINPPKYDNSNLKVS